MTARHVRPVERVAEITGGAMADVVMDLADGTPSTVPLAVKMARRGGRSPRGVMATLHGKLLLKMIALENCRPARRSRRGDSRIALPRQ